MFSPIFLAISADLAHLSFIQQKSLKPGTLFSVPAASYQTIMHQVMTLLQNLLAWKGSSTWSVVGGGGKMETIFRLDRVFKKSLTLKTSRGA